MGSCSSTNYITHLIHNGSADISFKDEQQYTKIVSTKAIKFSIKKNILVIDDAVESDLTTNYFIRTQLKFDHIFLNSSGDLTVDKYLLASHFTCTIEGTGTIHIKDGVFESVNIAVIGDGNIKFVDSLTKTLTGDISGAGSVYNLVVLNESRVAVSGSGEFKCFMPKS